MAKKIKERTTRELLINAIIRHASDELDREDWMQIAALDEEQLVKQVISILEFYANKYNS